MQQQGNHRLLLIGTLAFVVIIIAVAPIIGRLLNSLPAVLLLLVLYWAAILSLTMLATPRTPLIALYRTPANRRLLELVLTWLPVFATFFLVFLPSAPHIPLAVWIAIAGVAIINGFAEELFWRGAFISVFKDNILLAYIYPSVLFTTWHIALALLPGLRYPNSSIALIGGAAALGFAWGWVVWRTRDLRSVSIAHALTNFFAFGGTVLFNWVDL